MKGLAKLGADIAKAQDRMLEVRRALPVHDRATRLHDAVEVMDGSAPTPAGERARHPAWRSILASVAALAVALPLASYLVQRSAPRRSDDALTFEVLRETKNEP